MVIVNFMARVRKLVAKAPPKCKTPDYSRPWMAKFLADALKSADLPGAMSANDVGWGDYVRGRRLDPAFDLACQEIDLIVRHALLIQLESRAAAGDFKAAKLLAGGLAEIRKTLTDVGVDPAHPPALGDDRFPGRQHLGHRHPEGPCLQCMGGLVVLVPGATGDDHEIIVRNDEARGWEIPMPVGWESAKLVYGSHIDASKLVLDPEGSGTETEGGI
jgi:hypothetical protein